MKRAKFKRWIGTRPILPLRPGVPARQSHDYVRNGTTSLFAALDVATGKVIGSLHHRQRHQEFLRFLEKVDAAIPESLDIHLVMDNYGTHKMPKVKRWFARRPRYHLHFTPTSASWLNQVERFFGLLTERRIRRGTFGSVRELESAIRDYLAHHNENPKPFKWTADADSILKKIQRFCVRTSDSGHQWVLTTFSDRNVQSRIMAAKKKTQDPAKAVPKSTRTRREGKFPALTFQEALALPNAIRKHAADQKVRRLTLFEKLDQSPDSMETRRLITASGQYGLTKGSYQSEYLELTPNGNTATSEDVPAANNVQARFDLAVAKHAPFSFLHQKLKGNRMSAKEVLEDYLSEANVEEDDRAECIDTFILNAKFLGLLRTIAGSERLISIEQAVEEAPHVREQSTPDVEGTGTAVKVARMASLNASDSETVSGGFEKICF